MSGGVFVVKDATTLVAMKPASFASEDIFQSLIAQFPALLDGVQGESGIPRRWLLLGREKGIQSEDGGSDRWAIDHLFLDQDGIPTFVEIKRKTDTRLRREVVGQMLDYVSNAVAYFSWERLRDQFEADCASQGEDVAMAMVELLGVGGDANLLWQKVKTNLQAGRVRLLFVADLMPPEVKRIVEFLNRQMDPAEVLAVELKQYEGEGLRTIVPSIYGRTEEAQKRKSVSSPKRRWDEASIIEDLSCHLDQTLLPIAQRIINWIKANSDGPPVFGGGTTTGAITASFNRQGRRLNALTLWTSGDISPNFGAMTKPPFDVPEIREEWAERLGAVPGVKLPQDAANRYPNIKVSAIADNIDQFLEALSWLPNRL
jgi:hypothetical protein